MDRGYSYIRFSSRQQRRGNSIARQTKTTEAWCGRHGVTLDTSRELRDLAVSGRHGENHKGNPDRYALAGFLEMVRTGDIAKGSYLIIENLDRLTREDIVPAVNLFTSILMEGIRIVQLMPIEHVFDQKSDMPHLMMAVMELSRGNSESVVKSERVGSAWRKRKKAALESKAPVSAMCPKWLELREGRYQPIPDRVKVVRQIFRWCIDGIGIGVIARKLNDEGVKPFGERGEDHKYKDKPQIWQKSSVARILKNRATLGEYQPGEGSRRKPVGDLIIDYYPRVVEKQEFDRAQAAVKNRAHRRSDKRQESRNLFTGLLVSIDGKPYNYHGSQHKRGVYEYVVPAGGRLMSTEYVSMPYSALERAILTNFSEIKPADLTTGKETKLAERLGALGSEIEDAKGKATKFRDRIYSDPDNDTWPELEKKAKEEVARLTAEYQELRMRLSSPVVETVTEAQSLIQAVGDPEKRTKLKAKLAALVKDIGLHVWEDYFRVEGSKVVSVSDGQQMKVAWVQIRFKHSDHVRNMVFSHTPGYGTTRPAKVHMFAVGDAPVKELEFNEDNAVDVERFFAHGEIGKPKEI